MSEIEVKHVWAISWETDEQNMLATARTSQGAQECKHHTGNSSRLNVLKNLENSTATITD